MKGSRKPSLNDIEAMSRQLAREIAEHCNLSAEDEMWIAVQIMKVTCELFDVFFEEISYEG